MLNDPIRDGRIKVTFAHLISPLIACR
jgi:hypothetical protein